MIEKLKTIEELKKIPSLSVFLTEYEKLAKAMKKGHESEMRLAQRCKILIADKKRAVVKIQSAMNVAIEDQGTIDTFKKVIILTFSIIYNYIFNLGKRKFAEIT